MEIERSPQHPEFQHAEDLLREGTRWSFDHPTRGTCVPGCSSFGECHCGCGGRPRISHITVASTYRVAGRPFTFVSGHQLRVIHPRAGIWSKNGVPVERVRPLLLWLRQQHGSIRAVATLLDTPEATISGYVYNTKRKRVPPEPARRIAALVLAHRKRPGPLDLWEEQPGLRSFADPMTLRRRSTT